MEFSVEKFVELTNNYFIKEEGLGRTVTLTGLASYLGVPSRELMRINSESEHYYQWLLCLDRLAVVREAKMDPNKWMNTVLGWITTERQEIENNGGLNIKIDTETNLNNSYKDLR